jgi:hypothetical protein
MRWGLLPTGICLSTNVDSEPTDRSVQRFKNALPARSGASVAPAGCRSIGTNSGDVLPESRPDVPATLTTMAFDHSSLRWLEINT